MPNKDKLAMRYAARLTAIYDYITVQVMDRDYNSLNRTDCIQALNKLGRVPETLELHNLWSQVSNECSGIKNEDVEAIEVWRIQDAYKYYNMQKREIEASLCLRDLMEKSEDNLFQISERNNVYCWTLQGWTTFQKRITWYLVLSIEELKASGKPFTIDDALQRMAAIKQNYIEEQRMKK